MFNHYRHILPEHHVALTSCVRNHVTVTAPLLASLYASAQENLQKAKTQTGLLTSHISAGNMVIGTATDANTGFFVQLVKLENNEKPLLTVGAKWVVEQFNAAQGNTATKLW